MSGKPTRPPLNVHPFTLGSIARGTLLVMKNTLGDRNRSIVKHDDISARQHTKLGSWLPKSFPGTSWMCDCSDDHRQQSNEVLNQHESLAVEERGSFVIAVLAEVSRLNLSNVILKI